MPEFTDVYPVLIIGALAALAIILLRPRGARPTLPAVAAPFELRAHLERQLAFSLRTFGPGQRTAGVLAHLRKELAEVEETPDDLVEWVDLMMLSFDGALRRGFTPEQICKTLTTKLAINEGRRWPDWRGLPEGQPIEHLRTPDDAAR